MKFVSVTSADFEISRLSKDNKAEEPDQSRNFLRTERSAPGEMGPHPGTSGYCYR